MPPAQSTETLFEHACLGGTFAPLHRGHKALILRALQVAEHVFIGVTDGELAHRNRDREVPPVQERMAAVQELLQAMDLAERAEVAPITDPFGRALEPQFEAIVVSPETAPVAGKINEARRQDGHPPLAVERVDFVLGLDGKPVNGTRVAGGEIDPGGRHPRRVVLAVGSANPVKIQAARHAFGRFIPDVDARGFEVASGVPEQPYDAQGPMGAVNRARAALEHLDEGGLGVGIEAAIHTQDPSGEHFDVQYCAIADEQGRVTIGAGPGFSYPPQVWEDLQAGKTVGEAVGELAGNAEIGSAEGAIGFLTDKGVTREELTEWAVLAALVPRLKPELYTPLPFE
ncbi:MAG: inosine/xanthosine triphosphatase [Candidatus Thermoplasmatota archaeon]|nr:inosine/xanthosine triphosphatase [Candidatus Thermoplasmatota archaeon]